MAKLVWDETDIEQAFDQGWNLFVCYGSSYIPDGSYQLQRIDDLDVYKSDEEVWKAVHTASLAGDPLAEKALRVLAQDTPNEYFKVCAYAEGVDERLDNFAR